MTRISLFDEKGEEYLRTSVCNTCGKIADENIFKFSDKRYGCISLSMIDICERCSKEVYGEKIGKKKNRN